MSNDTTAWEFEETPAPLHEQSLEEVFERGETHHDQESGYVRVCAHGYPAMLQAVAFGLSGQVNLGKPAVYRLTTKLGAARLRALVETGLVEHVKQSLQAGSDILDLNQAFAPHKFHFRQRILVAGPTRRENVNAFGWVQGLMGDLATIFDLSMSEIATLSVIAGFAHSTELVREDVAMDCWGELNRFRSFLANEWALQD